MEIIENRPGNVIVKVKEEDLQELNMTIEDMFSPMKFKQLVVKILSQIENANLDVSKPLESSVLPNLDKSFYVRLKNVNYEDGVSDFLDEGLRQSQGKDYVDDLIDRDCAETLFNDLMEYMDHIIKHGEQMRESIQEEDQKKASPYRSHVFSFSHVSAFTGVPYSDEKSDLYYDEAGKMFFLIVDCMESYPLEMALSEQLSKSKVSAMFIREHYKLIRKNKALRYLQQFATE